MRKWILAALSIAALLALLALGGAQLYQQVNAASAGKTIPTTSVQLGDVVFSVTARGDLQGGNSVVLTAPMTGARELVLKQLRRSGELVREGDIVAQFDTTEEEYKLREAEADLAEAEQKVIQAKAESTAREEEDNYALIKARAELRIAELEARRNPLLAAIAARQNDLAVQAARDQLNQLKKDLAARRATSDAGIAMQEAARKKAQSQAETARRNIESMMLRAKRAGYVSIQQNQNSNFWYPGLVLPLLQVGDTVRAGMAVAQILDMKNWEVVARISELDRGHLALGQKAEITVVALPGKVFHGRISDLGGTTGPPWDRRFECKLTLDDPQPELRPGMSARIVITTEKKTGVLWVPSQAVFESDGRTFVYLKTPEGFRPADVKVVRRSESQVVIEGLKQGQLVALASPDQKADAGQGKRGPAAATKAMAR